MKRRRIPAEDRAVYDAEFRASTAWPSPPLPNGRAVRSMMLALQEATPELRGVRVRLKHTYSRGRQAWSWGGFENAQASALPANPTLADWENRRTERRYFVQIDHKMRTVWTIAHELAHVLEFTRVPGDCRSLGHGIGFRRSMLHILEGHDPFLAQTLRVHYALAGLTF